MPSCSTSARDALARLDVDPASFMMVKRTEYGVVCPVTGGDCGWPLPTEGFERETDPLQVEIGRIDKLEAGESMHFVTGRSREAPVPQRGEDFVQQCVIRPPNTGPPVGLARARRQLSGDIDQCSTVHRRDKSVAV